MIKKLKRKMKTMKISHKLTILYSLMINSILLLFTVGVCVTVFVYIDRQNTKMLTNASQSYLDKINAGADILAAETYEGLNPVMDCYALLLDVEGSVVYNPSELPDGYIGQYKATQNMNTIYREVDLEDYEMMFVNQTIESGGKIYILQTVKTLSSEIQFFGISLLVIASFVVIFVVTSVLSGFYLNKKMLKPITDMAENADSIQKQGITSQRITLTENNDEIYHLGKTINEMLDRIEAYNKRQVAFISDASHELKTPVAVILSYSQMIKSWAKDDKAALEKSMDCIEQEAINMKDLLERLLLTANSESGSVTLENSDFALNELIDEIEANTKLIAQNRDINILQNDDLTLYSDRKLLKELIRILLDNSIKFTGESGVINLSSAVEGHTLTISVDDNGTGIRKEDMDKIFDRFYCADYARTKGKSGNGLGLAIAKRISQTLGFSISVESREGVYTKFTLQKTIN